MSLTQSFAATYKVHMIVAAVVLGVVVIGLCVAAAFGVFAPAAVSASADADQDAADEDAADEDAADEDAADEDAADEDAADEDAADEDLPSTFFLLSVTDTDMIDDQDYAGALGTYTRINDYAGTTSAGEELVAAWQNDNYFVTYSKVVSTGLHIKRLVHYSSSDLSYLKKIKTDEVEFSASALLDNIGTWTTTTTLLPRLLTFVEDVAADNASQYENLPSIFVLVSVTDADMIDDQDYAEAVGTYRRIYDYAGTTSDSEVLVAAWQNGWNTNYYVTYSKTASELYITRLVHYFPSSATYKKKIKTNDMLFDASTPLDNSGTWAINGSDLERVITFTESVSTIQ